MKTDRYTKTILTVIASALVWIAVQNSIGTAHAAKDVSKVAICDFKNPDRCATVFPETEPQVGQDGEYKRIQTGSYLLAVPTR